MYSTTHFVSSNDRFGVPGTVEFQINELARKLKLSVQEVLMAVQEVGFDRDEIREYIRDRYDRC
ncbi:MAG: DUF3606 domain-containing protein [Chitinophagaceae bacterium]|nr:MAG: DUF3606 domain-containing protein [Chitinophagaceae bacterium]